VSLCVGTKRAAKSWENKKKKGKTGPGGRGAPHGPGKSARGGVGPRPVGAVKDRGIESKSFGPQEKGEGRENWIR